MIQYRTNIINDNENKYNTFFRKIKDVKIIKELNNNNLYCIDSERDNLFSTIEYLTLIGEKHNYKDLILVYINEKKSVNMSIIYNMFRDLEYIIIDPSNYIDNKSYMDNQNVKIILENYNDESYKKINELNKNNKKIIFFSNINYNEKELLNDLKKQELWCKQLNPLSYFIKLKLFSFNNQELEYLKGEKYISLYSDPKDYELNLINIKDNEKEELKSEKYDINILKEELNYFNEVERKKNYKFEESNILKYNLLGYDNGYESVCEYYIIYKYLLLKNKNDVLQTHLSALGAKKDELKNINRQIVDFLYKINKYYLDVLQISLVSCILKNSIENLKSEALELNKIKIEKIFLEYIQIIYSLKSQVNYFKKGDLLSKEDYKSQIELVKEIIDKLNIYMKKFMEKSEVKKSKNYYYMNKIVNENEYYLKFFITNYEKENNELKDNMILLKKIKKDNIQKHIKEYLSISQIPIINLYKELDIIKEEYPMNMILVDKKDYFFL